MPAKNNHVWKGKTLWPEIKQILDMGYPIIVYDLETTGLSSKKEHIIELAAIKYEVDSQYQLHEIAVYHQYINPGYQIPETITDITGITNEMVANMPSEADVYYDVKEFFDGCVVAGYNIDNFDNKFMSEIYVRMGSFFNIPGSIDCIKMARNRLTRTTMSKDKTKVLSQGDVENYKLSTIGAFFGIEFTAHSAIEDTRTTGKLIQLFINEYQEDEKEPEESVNGSIKPSINTISFWAGFRGFSRIYVNTDAGSVYYDVRSQTWGGKDVDVKEIDMEFLEKEVFRLTNSQNETEFAKFKGAISI